METLCAVCQELPDIQFVFAGKGPLKNLLDGIDNVKDIGFQPQEELKLWIRNAKFVIVPSEWYEPFGLSVIESISLKTPVIGADIAGIKELVEDNSVGVLYEAGDDEELKGKILKLWTDDIVYTNLKEGCDSYRFMTIDEYYHRLINEAYTGEDRDENTNHKNSAG